MPLMEARKRPSVSAMSGWCHLPGAAGHGRSLCSEMFSRGQGYETGRGHVSEQGGALGNQLRLCLGTTETWGRTSQRPEESQTKK